MWGTAPHHADISPHSPVSIVTNGNLLSTAAAATRGSACAPPARMLQSHLLSHSEMRTCSPERSPQNKVTLGMVCVCKRVCITNATNRTTQGIFRQRAPVPSVTAQRSAAKWWQRPSDGIQDSLLLFRAACCHPTVQHAGRSLVPQRVKVQPDRQRPISSYELSERFPL